MKAMERCQGTGRVSKKGFWHVKESLKLLSLSDVLDLNVGKVERICLSQVRRALYRRYLEVQKKRQHLGPRQERKEEIPCFGAMALHHAF